MLLVSKMFTCQQFLCFVCRQIFGIIFVSVGQLLTVDLHTESLSNDKCGLQLATSNHTYCGSNITSSQGTSDPAGAEDWTNAGLMFLVATFIGHILFTLFFHPKYKRLAVEKEANKSETT